MISYLLILLLFITTLVTTNLIVKYKTKKIITPYFFYSVFWFFWLIISVVNPLNLFNVSLEVYLLIFISIFMFFLAFLFFVSGNNSKLFIYSNNKVIKEKYILLIQVTVSIVLILYLIRFNNLVSIYGPGLSREIRFETGYLIKSKIESIFYNWIILYSVYITGVYSIVTSVSRKKITKGVMFATINIILFASIGDGRMVIFDFVVFLLLTLSFYNFHCGKLNFKIKIKKRYIILGIIIIIYTALFIQARRLNVDVFSGMTIIVNRLTEQIVTYFTGPFIALDTFLDSQNVPMYSIFQATFAGVTELIDIILNFVNIDYLSGSELLSSVTKEAIMISPTHRFNAFYTSILNFYLDGGVFGVVVFSAICGSLVAKAYNFYISNKNITTLMLIVYITWMLIASVYRFPSAPANFLILFTLIFAANSYKKRGVSKNRTIEV